MPAGGDTAARDGASVRIAICIPAYNAEATLPRLFESIRNQESAFDEVLLYDDASADGTARLAQELGARVVSGRSNIGCSAGKNALLAEAACEWVHFHDADDIVLPGFVALAKERLVKGGVDALLFDYEQVDESSGALMSRSDFAATDLLEDPLRFMLRNTVNNGGVYSTERLRRAGGFDEDAGVRFNEDRAFHLRLAEQGFRFAIESHVGCRFYFTAGSMSANNQVRCAAANQEITRRFFAKNPGRYLDEISAQSWHNAGVLATFLAWAEADRCVELGVAAGGKIPAHAGLAFKSLCMIDGKFAIRAREWLIRRFRPQLRRRSGERRN